jgi:hypothetical protein
MALRLGALHDALMHPGDGDLARRAAEEVAAYDNRLASLDTRLAVLTWMVGFLIALGVANLWLTMNILNRLPRP